MGLHDFMRLEPMESAGIVWLPFVSNYRTFLINPIPDCAELFAAIARVP